MVTLKVIQDAFDVILYVLRCAGACHNPGSVAFCRDADTNCGSVRERYRSHLSDAILVVCQQDIIE